MNSTVKIKQLVKKAKRDGMSAVALTDRNVLHGTISFYQACLDEGINPIIGMETTVIKDDQISDVILLAKSHFGYRSLMKISSLIQVSSEMAIEFERLIELLEDCFVILPIKTTKIVHYIENNKEEEINRYLESWPIDTLIGCTRFDLKLMDRMEGVAHKVVALGDVCYLEQSDHEGYQYLRAIDKKENIEQADHKGYHHLYTQEEANAYFENYPELINKTIEIANQCKVELTFDQQLLPKYPLEEEVSATAYLRQLCEQAMVNKYSKRNIQEAKNRLDYEISTIDKMGFSDYFLIVWDFIEFAKSREILVGPGRGSAAGSIVSYLLGITSIDPIKYELLFERFLNPERVTMPDIDVDFSDYRRDEVIDYVKEKYGKQYVAQIGTFNTFKTRSTIRELAKVFELSPDELNFILREVPAQGKDSIASTVKQSNALLDTIKQSERFKTFFRVAHLIEGLPRNTSTHAAGVIIHDQKLTDFIPLMTDGSENILTQYAMDDLEKIGLLKMDFLGLRNLTTIERILKMIKRDEKNTIDLEEIPLDDPKTYSLFQAGLTNGIFQFESQGMKSVLKRLKPTIFEDIVAVNALYRPGPMDFIDTYVKRKNNVEQTSYIHKDLEPILKETHGVLVYQEQIIELTHQIAGLSLGRADLLRRAISKKDQSEIEAVQEEFVKGCLQKGYSEEVGKEIFSWISRFANYGFNRSHAVAYSTISYYLAYLKANYPVYFLTELLNTVAGDHSKTSQYMKELKEKNIKLLTPTINNSVYYYQAEKGNVRMGLSAVKGISYPIVTEIIQNRKGKPFKDLFDFCLRVSLKVVTRKHIETLVLAGVFDEFNIERASLLATIDQAMDQGELFGGLNGDDQLFGAGLNFQATYQDVTPFSLLEKLTFEKDLLGLYVSDHPLDINRQALRTSGIMDLSFFHKSDRIKDIPFALVIQDLKTIRTKRGESMAFVELADDHLEVEGVIFPDLYREVRPWLEKQMFVLIKGKKEHRQGKEQIIVQEVKPIDLAKVSSLSKFDQRLFIKIDNSNNLNVDLELIERLAQDHPGPMPVLIFQADKKETFILKESNNLSDHYHVINQLKKHFGNENVVMQKVTS